MAQRGGIMTSCSEHVLFCHVIVCMRGRLAFEARRHRTGSPNAIIVNNTQVVEDYAFLMNITKTRFDLLLITIILKSNRWMCLGGTSFYPVYSMADFLSVARPS